MDKEEIKDIKKLLSKSTIFLPLVLFLVIFPTIILFASGELMSSEAIAQRQNNWDNLVLVGKSYNHRQEYYKLHVTKTRKPKIIALGSSRVMPFRSKFFNFSRSFYNAGGAARKPADFLEFLNRIPEGDEPEVIIIGLDQVFFNPNWYLWPEIKEIRKKEKKEDFYNRLFSSQNTNVFELWIWARAAVLKDYFINRKFALKDIFSLNSKDYDKIGLQAYSIENGLLNDGTWYYGNVVKGDYLEYKDNFSKTINMIKHGLSHYEYSNDVAQDSIENIELFLKECKKRNIHVVAFIPPFPHTVIEAFKLMKDKHGYIFKLNDTLKPLFNKYGYSMFDFSDLAWLNASDRETYDGKHASEKAYLRLFLRMIKKDVVLRKHAADEAYLRKRLAESKSDHIVFEKYEL